MTLEPITICRKQKSHNFINITKHADSLKKFQKGQLEDFVKDLLHAAAAVAQSLNYPELTFLVEVQMNRG